MVSVLLAFCPKVFECFIFCRIKLYDRSDSHSGGIAKSFLKKFILDVLGKDLLYDKSPKFPVFLSQDQWSSLIKKSAAFYRTYMSSTGSFTLADLAFCFADDFFTFAGFTLTGFAVRVSDKSRSIRSSPLLVGSNPLSSEP